MFSESCRTLKPINCWTGGISHRTVCLSTNRPGTLRQILTSRELRVYQSFAWFFWSGPDWSNATVRLNRSPINLAPPAKKYFSASGQSCRMHITAVRRYFAIQDLWNDVEAHSRPHHIHCFIRDSKLAFSANLFHHSLLAPTGMHSRNTCRPIDRTFVRNGFHV